MTTAQLDALIAAAREHMTRSIGTMAGIAKARIRQQAQRYRGEAALRRLNELTEQIGQEL
jgi:hypothetical protein